MYFEDSDVIMWNEPKPDIACIGLTHTCMMFTALTDSVQSYKPYGGGRIEFNAQGYIDNGSDLTEVTVYDHHGQHVARMVTNTRHLDCSF